MASKPAAILGLSSLLGVLTGCGAPLTVASVEPVAPSPALAAAASEETDDGLRADGVTCTTLRRDEGAAVEDAFVSERWPSATYGASQAAFAGPVGGAERKLLVKFDLSSLAGEREVRSATLVLFERVCSSAVLDITPVREAWDERDVSWASLASSTDSTTRAVPTTRCENGPRHLSVDVTELARGWVRDGESNHGVAVSSDRAVGFATSEVTDASLRPALQVCFASPRASEPALVATAR